MSGKNGGPRNIAIEACAFCYGPASIGLAVAQAVRVGADDCPVRLIALGEKTSFELFSASSVFDEVHALGLDDLDNPKHPGTTALRGADVLVSVGDFEFAHRVAALGHPAVVVDPLYWMWDKMPIRIDACRDYYALDFPGVRTRVEEYAREVPDDRAPTVVEPIYDLIATSPLSHAAARNTLLINFGGMQSPLGTNLTLALAQAQDVVRTALEHGSYDEIRICGGGAPIRQLASQIGIRDPRLHVGPMEQGRFFEELAACRHFLTVPGLSIVYEALHFRKNTLFLLPLNYSQHRQSRIYRRVLGNAPFITFDDLAGYGSLPDGLPEHDGVARALALGDRYASDPAARQQLRETVRRFLNAPSDDGLALRAGADSSLARFGGARQIASGVLQRVREARMA